MSEILRSVSDINIKPLKTNLHGYIYALHDGNLTKIGMTKTPSRRIALLIREHSIKTPEFKISGQIKGYRYRERLIHEKYDRLRINGEWFDISLNDVDFSATKPDSLSNKTQDIEEKIERIVKKINANRVVPLTRNDLLDMAIKKLQKTFFK